MRKLVLTLTLAVVCSEMPAQNAFLNRLVPDLRGAIAGQRCHLEQTETVQLAVPGRAFSIRPTSDGCWLFVSMDTKTDGSGGGLAVIDLRGSAPKLARTIPLAASVRKLAGMALTHGDNFLFVGGFGRLSVYDVKKLIAGDADPLAGEYRPESKQPPLYFNVAITADDRLVFASDHNGETVTVINLETTRRSNFKSFAVIGDIPVGYGSNSVVLSPDERHLYVTSQIATDIQQPQKECRAPGAPPTAAPTHPKGVLQVIDMTRVGIDPAHSVLKTTAAGCDPVRFILDSSGKRGYVTSRSDDQFLTYDTARLLDNTGKAQIGSAPTSVGPVGIAFLDGRHIAVANALRFSGGKKDTEGISIIDTGTSGQPSRSRSVASAGPVDIALMPDGKTLVVANYEPEQVTFLSVHDLLKK